MALTSSAAYVSADRVVGRQRPSHCWVPPRVASWGPEAVELAALSGLIADAWQEFVVEGAMGVREDGRWSAFEVGLLVPRQNGKGGVLEIRELAGLFLLPEQLLIHSAHEFKTSLAAFRRMLRLIESAPDLDRQVMRVSRSHGEEGIELRDGSRIQYQTRTAAGGRGLTGDLVVLDEAMKIAQAAVSALMPALRAVPNPQIWYTGSAVDQTTMDHGLVFAGVRKRGLASAAAALAA